MSAAALERQVKPVYDALDTGSPKTAVVHCNKLLKKYPNLLLIKALKSLALVRLQKFNEAITLCDQVLASKTTDDATLSAMQHVLRGLGRHKDMIAMFEAAFQQMPGSADFGNQYFFANVRAGFWKPAQQIALKQYKQFQDEKYLYWSIICYINQANDPTTPADMKKLLFQLAHRLIKTSLTPSSLNADRFYLHLTILRQLELYDEAHAMLVTPTGASICSTSLLCNEIRRDICKLKGLYAEEAASAEVLITEAKDRNWLEFLSVIDGVFDGPADQARLPEDVPARYKSAENLFKKVIDVDAPKDRTGLLGLVELEKRARLHKASKDDQKLVDLMKQYFQRVGGKPCCYEDLRPYVTLEEQELQQWTDFLTKFEPNAGNAEDLQRYINAHLLARLNLKGDQLSTESESQRAQSNLKLFKESVPLGARLLPTDPQPGDELLVVAAEIFVNLWKNTSENKWLYNAIVILQHGLVKSEHAFQMRVMLIRIYRLLAAPSLALEHYRLLNVKQIQHDTMSHHILSRASTFSLAALGDLTYLSECLESSQIYLNNSNETSDHIVRAFQSERYSQISEFITFEDRVDNSLARDIVKLEHVRMRVAHETINSDLVDLELIELKFIFYRLHYDNRDFDILPSHQPHGQSSFNEQTTFLRKSAGMGWLWVFLRIYIRVFHHASDLDDSSEDHLILGDRPKQVQEASKTPWKERLLIQKDADLEDLTSEEKALTEYITELGDWLEPFHDHLRTPKSTVSTEPNKKDEAAKQSQTDKKKLEDIPPLHDPSSIVVNFFQGSLSRLQSAIKEKVPYSEVLHIASIAQEALLLFSIEASRFKPPAIAKSQKLGPLVAHLKSLRAQAVEKLQAISEELSATGENIATAEARKSFQDSSQLAIDSLELNPDTVLDIAKAFTTAQKQVLSGIGQTIVKVLAKDE